MKYIKLYEAFESVKLSKTLQFINSADRENLINNIKKVCQKIDFPFSQLSDEYFEYLPFRRALLKSDMTGDESCEATSEKEFPEYAVPGAKCEGGKLRRLWGARTREVVCPVCSGTGVKPKKSELKLLKFWFDKDGKYLTTTAVDGLVRASKNRTSYSRNLSNFDIDGRNLRISEVRELTTGQPVYLNCNQGTGVGYVFRERDRVYVVQDFASGSSPYYASRSEWQKFGQYCWQIDNSDDYNEIKKLKLREDADEVDPYTWNVGIDNSRWNYGDINLRFDVENNIKDANFALILDFGKIKKSDFKTKTEISGERQENREGALALQKDADIKSANIKRYMANLAKSVDIVSDLSNVNKLIKRYLGGRNVIFFMMNASRFGNSLSDIIDYYYNVMSSSESDKAYHVEQLETRIRRILNEASTKNQKININLEQIKNKLRQEGKTEYLTLIEEISKFSEELFNKFSSINIETIDDLEVVRQKIYSIKNLFDTSRYEFNRFRYVAEYLDRDSFSSAYRYLTDYYIDNPEKITQSLPLIKSLVNKLV
jgi:hypothetical protein